MPQSKLAIIYRLRSEIEAKETQLYELESEALEEVLTKGPIEDADFECHATRTSHEGKIVYDLQVYKRRRSPSSAHGQDLIAIHHRLAMAAYAIVSAAAAFNLP